MLTNIKCFLCTFNIDFTICFYFSTIYARLKNGAYYGNTCGGRAGLRAGARRPQDFRSFNQRCFVLPLSNLVTMIVGIISRPSFMTSQIPLCTSELWPLNCPKVGFPLSKSNSFCPVLIKLDEYVSG